MFHAKRPHQMLPSEFATLLEPFSLRIVAVITPPQPTLPTLLEVRLG
jgi:hypothetical protein